MKKKQYVILIGLSLIIGGLFSHKNLYRFIFNDYNVVNNCGVIDSIGTYDGGRHSGYFLVLKDGEGSQKYKFSDTGVYKIILKGKTPSSILCFERYERSYDINGRVIFLNLIINGEDVYSYKKGSGESFLNIIIIIGVVLLIVSYFTKNGVEDGKE